MEPGAIFSLPTPSLIRKKVPVYCQVDRELSSRQMAKPWFSLTTFGDFLHHNQIILTIQLRHLSKLRSLPLLKLEVKNENAGVASLLTTGSAFIHPEPFW